MKKRHIAAGIFGMLLVLVLIVPLIIPVAPLRDTVKDASELAYPESRFTNINGLQVHYRMEGRGKAIVLLHGFGASLYSWREVITPLSKYGTVIAFDYPPFGLTGRYTRETAQGKNRYGVDTTARLTVSLLQGLGFSEAVLVGNSLGGLVATVTALSYPSNVRALVLVDAAIYGGGPPAFLPVIAQLPQVDAMGPLISRQIKDVGVQILVSAWHDSNRVTPDIIANYRRPLRMPDWDKALWAFTTAPRPAAVVPRLESIRMPVMIITGDNDRLVPMSNSVRLASDIHGAKLTVISNCGHVPQEEKPAEFLAAVTGFLRSVK